MQMGMVGLGRMGANMVVRLSRNGHQCVVNDRSAETMAKVVADTDAKAKAVSAASLKELVEKLPAPRAVWLMIPAGIVDKVLGELVPLLSKGDTVIDGGNSYYIDDIRRSKELAAKGINYIDVGTSGGVWGVDRGYCLMIGGDNTAEIKRLEPIFSTLAPGKGNVDRTPGRDKLGGTAEAGYLHCGQAGGGHFVKMVHNGIEYGLMAAYAEGLNILKRANVGKAGRRADSAEESPLQNPEHFQYDFNLADVTEVWRRGSVVASWLLDLTAAAMAEDQDLKHDKPEVPDSGEGRWTVLAAVEEGVSATVISASLFQRFSSRQHDDYACQIVQAMRRKFGGH